MNTDEIRSLNHDCQKEINETKTEKQHRFGIDSLNSSMLTEVAAQLAELNEKLKNILSPPVMYDIGPNERMGFSDDLPQPIMMVHNPRATLRDQLAMAAMQAYISCDADGNTFWVEKETKVKVSKESYEWADAMLEARK